MDIGVVSVRYARALLKFACEEKAEEQAYVEMQTLANSFIEVPALRAALENPRFTIEQKLGLLMQAAGGKVSAVLTKFFALVMKEHREMYLQFMANDYVDLYREQKKITRVALTTAVSVSDETEKRLQAKVAGLTHENVEVTAHVDDCILGGFILDYDTYRLDASVASELKNIRKQLGGRA